jgi:hypothetical protein
LFSVFLSVFCDDSGGIDRLKLFLQQWFHMKDL